MARPPKTVKKTENADTKFAVQFPLTPEANDRLLAEFGTRRAANHAVLTMIHERYNLPAPVKKETAAERKARELREEEERVKGLEEENARLKAELEALRKK